MLANREELLDVLSGDPRRIGKVFARHAYGWDAAAAAHEDAYRSFQADPMIGALSA